MLFRNALSFGMRVSFGRAAVVQRSFARNIAKDHSKIHDLKTEAKAEPKNDFLNDDLEAITNEAQTDANVQDGVSDLKDTRGTKPKVERFNKFGHLGFESNINKLEEGQLFDKKSIGKETQGDSHFYGKQKDGNQAKMPKDKKSKKTKDQKFADSNVQNEEKADEDGDGFREKGESKSAGNFGPEEKPLRKFKFDNQNTQTPGDHKGAQNRPYKNRKGADLDEREEEEFENFAKERGLTSETENQGHQDKPAKHQKFDKSSAKFNNPQDRNSQSRNQSYFKNFEEGDQQNQRNDRFRPGSKEYNRQPRYNDIQKGNSYKDNNFRQNRDRDSDRSFDRNRDRDRSYDRNRDRDSDRNRQGSYQPYNNNRDRDRDSQNQPYNNNRFQSNRDGQNSQNRYENKSKNQLKKEYREDIQKDKKIEIKSRSPYNNRPNIDKPNEDRSEDPEFMKKRKQPIKSFEARKTGQKEANQQQKDNKPKSPANKGSAEDDEAGY